MAEQTKTPLKFWKELSWFEIGAIVLIIGFMIYLKNVTALVVNFNDSNETRVINNIQNPPNTILYAPNSLVPKSNISNTQLFFEILLFSIVVLMLLSKRVSLLKRATPKEAIDDLEKQMGQLKEITLADGTRIPVNDLDIKFTRQFTIKYKTIGGERKESRYAFLVFIKDKKKQVEYYFRAHYHPWTRYWDGFFETPTPIQETDKCPNCGTEADEKIIMAEDLARLRELRRGMGITR